MDLSQAVLKITDNMLELQKKSNILNENIIILNRRLTRLEKEVKEYGRTKTGQTNLQHNRD